VAENGRNRVMRMLEPEGKELTGSWKNYAMTFKIWTLKADSHIAYRAAKGLECLFPM
jgi:hypothetical protein